MILVFTKKEVAAALGKSARRFDELRPALEAMGFPRPVPGLGACWSILQVSQWINAPHVIPAPASSPEAVTVGGGASVELASPSAANVLDIQKHLEARYGGRA